MTRPASRRWWAVSLLVVALSGCSLDLSLAKDAGTGAEAPLCRLADGQIAGDLVLMAQSVPTAHVLPCLRRLPEGWSVGGFHARNGQTKLWLTVGRENRTALTVVLQRRCNLDGFTEVQSDVLDTSRFDRLDGSGSVLRGSRAYVYSASCLRYDYTLLDASALPVLKTAIGTIERSLVEGRVEEDSRGHLRLDPGSGRTT